MEKLTVGDLTLENLVSTTSLKSLTKGYILNCRCEGKSPSTIAIYGTVLKNFVWFCERNNYPEQPQGLTPGHIREFLWYLTSEPNRWGANVPSAKKPASQTTVNDYYRALHSFFSWLQREELIVDSPLDHLKTPKVEKQVVHALTPREIERLFRVCSTKAPMDIRNRVILMVFLDCGLRVDEVAKLKLEDVDTETGTVIVRRGKGGKGRVVHIGSKTQKALYRYVTLCRKGSGDGLFLGRSGEPMNRDGLQTLIMRLGVKAGIKVYPHKLRHTFAISYLRNGGDIFSLKYLLGHKSLSMVDCYLQSLNAEDAASAHRRFSPVDSLL